jgi:hydrogenase/urease accessory protein HupE
MAAGSSSAAPRLPPERGLGRALAVACLLAVAALVVSVPLAAAHSGAPIAPRPPEQTTGWDVAWTFSGYGLKHILLGYDHLLFLAGLALLTTRTRHLVEVAGLFAISYSATLVGGTLAGVGVPGDLIDGIIAASVGFVGAQIAFTDQVEWLPRDPRPPALVFGLAHGLGLSSLLQELRLPGDALLDSVLGFNLGVEAGQIAALVVFAGALALARAFPLPSRERLPAGFALMSASAVLLSFLAIGVSL